MFPYLMCHICQWCDTIQTLNDLTLWPNLETQHPKFIDFALNNVIKLHVNSTFKCLQNHTFVLNHQVTERAFLDHCDQLPRLKDFSQNSSVSQPLFLGLPKTTVKALQNEKRSKSRLEINLKIQQRWKTSWCFQPIWKILVKMGIFTGMNIKIFETTSQKILNDICGVFVGKIGVIGWPRARCGPPNLHHKLNTKLLRTDCFKTKERKTYEV